MKKITALAFAISIVFHVIPVFALNEDSKLMSDIQVDLKSAENPNRLEVSFDLMEPIDLSEGDSNIIFEFLTITSTGNLEVLQYKKDKSWSGYLNSYDNYPAGEQKYSSGASNGNYSDNVPNTKIFTSTKTNVGIDVTLVAAVRITVLTANGSGEKVTVDLDGMVVEIEEISPDVVNQDKNAGIIIDTVDVGLPANTIVIANEVADGPVYEKINSLLTDVNNFIAIDINLESDGNKVQPDGKVKISIPIPEHFDPIHLVVYRIDNDLKIPYPVTISAIEGIHYATFASDHFSIYVLAEIAEALPESIPEITSPIANTSTLRREAEDIIGKNSQENIIEIKENEVPLSNTIPETGAANYSMTAGISSALIMLSLIINKRKR